MHELSHLTFEQRRTLEKLDRFWYAWEEGNVAAKRGESASTCPYDVRAGRMTPRRLWYEGYLSAIELERTPLTRASEENLRRCRIELSLMPLDELTALIKRIIIRAWRSVMGKPPLRAARAWSHHRRPTIL